jgi:hypothetical protein
MGQYYIPHYRWQNGLTIMMPDRVRIKFGVMTSDMLLFPAISVLSDFFYVTYTTCEKPFFMGPCLKTWGHVTPILYLFLGLDLLLFPLKCFSLFSLCFYCTDIIYELYNCSLLWKLWAVFLMHLKSIYRDSNPMHWYAGEDNAS